MQIDEGITAQGLRPLVERTFELAAAKSRALHARWDAAGGSPVYTIEGRYTARSWTDWTLGFFTGAPILLYDATGDQELLDLGREKTIRFMAPHLSHVGVHDHGFNIVSTYGNLRRLMLEGRLAHNMRELELYELALKVSGAVQAARYYQPPAGPGPLPTSRRFGTCGRLGYIYSFNGPHSLFADTIRSLRSLALAHQLGHSLWAEGDVHISLLGRLLDHAATTARYNVYFGEGRDVYDVRGRVAHESIFNTVNGQYRCPSTQQGYSPFSTWTRGAAWIILGYAEQIEYLSTVADEELAPHGGREAIEALFLRVLRATCDYYIGEPLGSPGYSCLDGIPYWDTGAPGLAHLGDYQQRPSDPYNAYEPVDSSAAAIAAQGLLRLGHHLRHRGDADAARYLQAGLTIAQALMAEPYLSTDPRHEGLLLHALYHRPNGWDHIPVGHVVPCGESCMWGDYHLLELALLIGRLAREEYLTFF